VGEHDDGIRHLLRQFDPEEKGALPWESPLPFANMASMTGRPWERTLGPAELPVTAIGLGLAALGRPGYLNLGHRDDLGSDRSVAALELRTHAVLDAAYDAGVRYFDAARSYGRAEAFFASWLQRRGLEPGEVTVGSKWGYTYTADWQVRADPPEVKDLSVDTFRRQLGETRDLVGEHLRLYQIHSATLESGVLDDTAVLSALAELRSGGVSVGLTTSGPDQEETVRQAIGAGGFDTVQATWNLLEPSAGPALADAHREGLGVIVKEALANGRLTSRGGCADLEKAAQRLGASPDAVALAAALAQPWADVVLSGAASTEQITSNLAAWHVLWDDEAVGALGHMAEEPAAYWRTRTELVWN
jgi:aryl-alcohol dehydrogenase-like predicted oxidoreductase